MKRFFLGVIVAIFLCIFITGCSDTPKEIKEYEEWYEALQINEHKGFKYLGSSHKDNRVSISIECDEEYLSEFCDVIKRHNEFVQQNPYYFPEDTLISILSSEGGSNPAAFLDCYNKPGEYFGEMSGPGIEENLEVKYMSVDVFDLKTAYDKHQNELSIPVLILNTSYMGTIAHDDFEFLKQFTNVEQVIIHFSELDYNMEEVASAVHEYCPGADVYEVIPGSELVKW